jgi:hypothetical protein
VILPLALLSLAFAAEKDSKAVAEAVTRAIVIPLADKTVGWMNGAAELATAASLAAKDAVSPDASDAALEAALRLGVRADTRQIENRVLPSDEDYAAAVAAARRALASYAAKNKGPLKSPYHAKKREQILDQQRRWMIKTLKGQVGARWAAADGYDEKAETIPLSPVETPYFEKARARLQKL